MSGAADALRARTAAIQSRDQAATTDPEPPPARTEPFRQTLDLGPDLYAELQRWRLDAAITTGRGRLTQHEVVYTAVLALVRDEVVGRRVRRCSRPVSPSRPPAPSAGRSELSSGGQEVRTSGVLRSP